MRSVTRAYDARKCLPAGTLCTDPGFHASIGAAASELRLLRRRESCGPEHRVWLTDIFNDRTP